MRQINSAFQYIYGMLFIAVLIGCSGNRQPNFVFILVDDLGWKDLGCYGSEFYETPHIDRLASKSMLFTDAYASCPVCSPTRASIMTGKYPSRLNITDWIPGSDPKDKKLLGPQDLHELPLSEVTIAETLKSNGYKTFFAGKWHLGDEGFFPEDQGFEINKGGHHKGSPPGGYYSPYKNPRLTDGPEGEYLTDRLANESINFLQKNKDNPFFLYLSFYSVHTPIQASKKHIKKFQDKAGQIFEQREPSKVVEHEGITITEQYNPAYASMIYAMDENVGRLLNEIEELDLTENTVIFFTSDNGGLSTLEANRTAPTSVLPLRAGKGWGYEGGIRVPLIVKSLGNQSNGKNKIPVISNDFYPTILELAGLPLMPNQHLDGVSIAPLLNGGTKLNRDAIFWHYPHYHGSSWTPGAAIRSGDWKLVEFYDYEKTELYNLKEDIGEIKDLSERYPEKVTELKKKLRQMQEETDAKFPTANPAFMIN
jgi:arylsulfatase A-like enzyme